MCQQHTTLKNHLAKKKDEAFSSNLKYFAIFDIRFNDKNRQKHWNVKETSLEKEFCDDQCKIPQVNNSQTHLFLLSFNLENISLNVNG